MSELKEQLDIIKSIRRQGGFARKWSSDFQVGIPDIVAALPGIGAFFIEVKFERVTQWNFDRKVGTTPLQKICLQEITEAGGIAMIGVAIRGPSSKDRWLHLLPFDAERVARDDHGCFGVAIAWEPGVGYNVRSGVSQIIGGKTWSE